MMEILKKVIDFAIKYLMKKKFLYKTIGLLAFTSLLTELATPSLPESLIPNYNEVMDSYGYLPALALWLFIGKYAGGYDIVAIGIKLFVVVTCLYLELKNNSLQGNQKSIKNYFFGLFQNINQKYD